MTRVPAGATRFAVDVGRDVRPALPGRVAGAFC
jgi:hypothetical protein